MDGDDFSRSAEATGASGMGGAVEAEDVRQFLALTRSLDEGQARFCLEACGGNLERAVDMYLSDVAGHGAVQGSSGPPSDPSAEQSSSSGMNVRNGGDRGFLVGFLGGLLRLPFTILSKTLGLVQSVVMYAVYIPWPQLRDDYERSHAEENSELQARQFIDRFEFHYGAQHPPFVDKSWREAAARAHREFKFLWVYVHSPEHEATDSFCREVLCAPEVVAFLSANFVCWGGDIRQSEAFRLAASLGTTTYPFQSLLAFSGSRTQPVSSMQGYLSPREMLDAIQQALDEQGALLVAERVDRERMDYDRQLRQEQDLEYERSLEKDKRLEAQRKKIQAEEAARKQAEREEEDRKRREIEAEDRKAEQMVAAIEGRKQQKQRSLKEEPAAGDEVAQIRIRMLDGSNHLRRFRYSDKVQDIFDYVDSLENLGVLSYSLVQMFPRKAFDDDGRDQTLVEAGLVPDSSLLVKSNDE
ncbi:unnamed protein product [Ostreobium quekettii]|uniref:UBX domain-containing protein n=1 Tax=Ostreobium quekettii TaxID=121088 RepID=A0A8S1IVU3_9CHLO|nr:unnamed protein product [Ostreobium quekettii]|eukprot:evm.model.scf_1386.4 EVM.evm.TU.scf_1386.4   scf_1386:17565-21938(-)